MSYLICRIIKEQSRHLSPRSLPESVNGVIIAARVRQGVYDRPWVPELLS